MRLASRATAIAAVAAVIASAGLLGPAAAVAATRGLAEAPATRPAETPPVAPPVTKPVDDRPLDARLYDQGLDAQRGGRRDEAARLMRKVYTDFPDSPWAPPALLKTAEMIYPVTAWSQVGSATPQSIQQATELLTLLTQKYRAAREAAPALVRLGFLGLEPAAPKSDLDEACGRFATAAQIYPDSDIAADAYFSSGMCDLLRDRPARAADVLARLIQEHPDSPLAEEAMYRYGIALSLLDDPNEATLALQALRTRRSDSQFAARALERMTLLHRMRILPAALRTATPAPPAGADPAAGAIDWTRLYRVDPDYGAALRSTDATQTIRGISDISIDAQGLAVVASPRAPGVFRLDARGKIQERIVHPGPDHVAAAEGLAVYISGRDQIAVNARNWSGPDLKGPEGRTPGDYGPIAIDGQGRVHMLDRRENAVLIYDRSRKLVGAVRPPAGKEGRFVDLATGDDGEVYALDGRARSASVITQGRESRRIDLSRLGSDQPSALTVDALGDLYILDDATGWVFVADATGRRITVVRPPKDLAARLGEVSAIAVDDYGRLYFAGRKSGLVVRMQ
ncbi:MAG TPA: tetratricopeptide repeat protein [Patescibacteria group bacterium]|nr:tetratricopeptide repeat protein [Patescibacteria group bacterium]